MGTAGPRSVFHSQCIDDLRWTCGRSFSALPWRCCSRARPWRGFRRRPRTGRRMGGRTRPRKTTARARRRPGRAESKIKPYDRVITKEAKTSAGLFLVHRLEDKVFFEIPTEELGKEMLWVTQLEQTQAGHSYGGEPVGDRVVRWEQRGDDVLLRDVKYEIRADGERPDQGCGEGDVARGDHRGVPDPGVRQGQAAGDRRDLGAAPATCPSSAPGGGSAPAGSTRGGRSSRRSRRFRRTSRPRC